jgi:pimeloyl-ACP methyl ester carboxylesterase
MVSLSSMRWRRKVAFATISLSGIFLGLAASLRATGQTTPHPKPQFVHSLKLSKFYDTPDPLPPASPGQLIRFTDFDEYNLPLHISSVRFLYYARSANGAPVAASGVILYPDKTPSPGGWPVIAWAHTLNGVARQCAPSLDRNLQHGPFLAMYVNLGYAVVATDYTGLGTSFRNAYADTVSNAWDVIDSVAAARNAMHQLGARWIAIGTGDGGSAAMKVAELEHDLQDSNYLGSVAISPSADMEDAYATAGNLSLDEPVFLAYGIKTVYQQFEPSRVLTEKAMLSYTKVADACLRTENTAGDSAAAMLKPNWQSDPFVQKFFSRNRLGKVPARAPLLVISTDTNPAAQQTGKVVEWLCQQKDQVQFEKFTGFNSGGVIGDSVRDQMNWVEGRFANRAAPNDCPSH